MALVTSLLTVLAMLGGMAALLWFTAVFEARHLGQAATAPALDPAPAVGSDALASGPVTDPEPASLPVIEAA